MLFRSKTITRTTYQPNGDVAGTSVSTVSANGLVLSVETDADGNLINESIVTDTTTYNSDGGRTIIRDVDNGDGSDRSLVETTISDDGLTVTTQTDVDGDGVFERVATAVSTLNADGSVIKLAQSRSTNNTLLSQTQTTVSDDGLITTTQMDADGDGDFDLSSETVTVLQNDGGTVTTTELRDEAGVLRNSSTVTSSDDGRSVTVASDINGDGVDDTLTTRVESDDGTYDVIRSGLNADGTLQSRSHTTTSSDGLTATTRIDRDGDGVFEAVTEDVAVFGADGSTTRTIENASDDGTVYSRSTVVTSDDGLTTTRSSDWNNDGAIDLTTTSTSSTATNGIETVTVENKAADNSVLDSFTKVTSADGRTVTASFDADGDGINDNVKTTTVGDDGQITTTSNYYSTGGTLQATYTSTRSGDGLTTTHSTDRNGDGEIELFSTVTTSLGEDGSVSRSVEHRNDRYIELGHEEYFTSDDGMFSSSALDLDGDGFFEFTTEYSTAFEVNGDIVNTRTTRDNTSALLANIITTTSGDGLVTSVMADYNGDASVDRTSTITRGADGSLSTVSHSYGGRYNLQQSITTTVSADGRIFNQLLDLNGDGYLDREVTAQTDLSQTVTTTYEDFALNGIVEASVVSTLSANGMHSLYLFDIDGDGEVDLTRATDVSYDPAGNEIITFTEIFGTNNVTYEEVTTTSADGLTSTTTLDIDGDGETDGTTVTETTLNADGSRVTTSETRYSDGDLRSMDTVHVSADGRTVTETHDYDGNGIDDKTVETVVDSDGRVTKVEKAFGEGGMSSNTFVTTTSADGLVTTILRSGNLQTITRSAVDNGSYTWDNGGAAASGQKHIEVTHSVDAMGIDTWTVNKEWEGLETRTGENSEGYYTYTVMVTKTSTKEQRLDTAAKQKLFAEAARIYDTVLDRDLDFNEVEVLIDHVVDGELNMSGLTMSLLGSGEFAARYGGMSHAEFVTQISLNTFGRPPSLDELNTYNNALVANTLTRVQIALEMSESSEHVVVGNGHMSTNNFDVIMNPAVFERSLDEAYTRSIIENLVDTIYDRDATEQELNYLSNRLLTGEDTPDEIAVLLLEIGRAHV